MPKKYTNATKIKILIFILVMAIAGCVSSQPREEIKFCLINTLDYSIYLKESPPWPIYNLYKFQKNKWVRIYTFTFVECDTACISSHLMISRIPPQCKELKPKEEIKFSWDQTQLFRAKKLCGIQIVDCDKRVNVLPGKYRVEICYSQGCIKDGFGHFQELDKTSLKCIEKEFNAPSDAKEIILSP